MTRGRLGQRIALELVAVLLILICVGGTLVLVRGAYQKASRTRKPLAERTEVASAAVTVAKVERPSPVPEPEPAAPEAPPAEPTPEPRPAEDPTGRVVSALERTAARENEAAREADRKAKALEEARRAAESETRRRKRREALVKTQLATLTDRARALEDEAEALALDRDVLARERDAAKAALESARARGGGYAVLPHKGANGTWQRPVIIECRDGKAILQPRGQSFTMLDMSPLLGSRSSPMVGAVARELMRTEDAESPDGTPVTPYIYFIVRPDGVRPFYEARGRLEPLGIAFGYELVDQDWEIEFPDLKTWEAGSRPSSDVGGPSGATAGTYRWPAERPSEGPKNGEANPFLWPRTPPGGTVDAGTAGGAGTSGSAAGNGAEPGRAPTVGRSVPDGLEGLVGQLGDGLAPPRGVDVTPLLDAFERLGPEGLQELLGRGRGRGGVAGEIPAEALTRLARGAGGESERGQELGETADPNGGGAGRSPGRVRIDPNQLAEDPFEGRPPASPRNSPLDPGASAGISPPTTGGGGSTGAGNAGGSSAGSGTPGGNSRVVEVPLDLVVACGPDGITVHPGGYRISKGALARERRLATDLATIVSNYERIDPTIIPRPRLEFLIEPGGHESFAEARRQTVFTGLDWPVTIRVAESSAPILFGKERF